ncbi:hypothetical protein M409DRAFT_29292 [Zasmidium cellare ATCC 36951]|uniref:Uncharacterized protein n=1 Tax=Zasmidium cellare ATCC 36951 TaxID=1080233 RepID=A0A6A6BZI2_ZASCE|nr:uncharacterized protein M409DRAFT_29292 [Zasmidium cellare ATCC 36951]KAF2160207.1 hypothetical protein M409DRAFT_29292 [Zasmidium cellare ATCC 36951]
MGSTNEPSVQHHWELEPVFRRVAHTAATEPAATNSLVQPTNVAQDRFQASPVRQPVDSRAVGHATPGTESTSVQRRSRLIIALDFGTAYSSVSYARIDPGVDPKAIAKDEIRCINNYESADGGSDARANAQADNVPTKLLYLGQKVPGLSDSETDEDSDDGYLSNIDVQPVSQREHDGHGRRKRGRKPAICTSRRKSKPAWSRPEGLNVHWGFVVTAYQNNQHGLARYEQKEAVELIKLTLARDNGQDEELQSQTRDLAAQIERLKSRSIVEDRDHLMCDYLARLLQHAKAILLGKGLLEGAQLEYVMSVPVAWSQSACRTMHNVLARAIQSCRLDTLAQNLIPDLFIVSEPEAAAQYVLASLGSKGRLRQGEVFIILDAGGGTVDITTYQVTSSNTEPLRLQGEMIPPDGALCGSSLITQRYLQKLKAKLYEIDPWGDRELLEGSAVAIANRWDLLDKPYIDVAHKKGMRLKYGGRQVYKQREIKWTEQEIREVFEPSLKGTIELLQGQLQLARSKTLIVSKLITVGGFGMSPSLRGRIREVLASRNDSGEQIEAIWPQEFSSSAVARGALLRALDKRNGPSRISRSSFGFLRHERYGDADEHKEAGAAKEMDPVDNIEYVRNTIHWVIQAGEELPSPFETEPILSCHTFNSSETKLQCGEKLYVSQRTHRSHFKFDHPQNQGAELLSDIVIDVSDLRRELPLEPLEPKADVGERTKVKNKNIRVVRFDLVVSVEGKQLKFEARWPPGARTPDEVRIRKSGYVSLAPSFSPGVA